MLGPQAWLERQKARQAAERTAKETARSEWARPKFEGYAVTQNERKEQSDRSLKEAEKRARSAMHKPHFGGGWERKSYFMPFVKNKAKQDAAEKKSKEMLAKPGRMSRISMAWMSGSRVRKQAAQERLARDQAQQYLRNPKFQGGWERKSIFHRVFVQKDAERKAKAAEKESRPRASTAKRVSRAASTVSQRASAIFGRGPGSTVTGNDTSFEEQGLALSVSDHASEHTASTDSSVQEMGAESGEEPDDEEVKQDSSERASRSLSADWSSPLAKVQNYFKGLFAFAPPPAVPAQEDGTHTPQGTIADTDEEDLAEADTKSVEAEDSVDDNGEDNHDDGDDDSDDELDEQNEKEAEPPADNHFSAAKVQDYFANMFKRDAQ